MVAVVGHQRPVGDEPYSSSISMRRYTRGEGQVALLGQFLGGLGLAADRREHASGMLVADGIEDFLDTLLVVHYWELFLSSHKRFRAGLFHGEKRCFLIWGYPL